VTVPTAASRPNGATVCQGTDANFSSTASGTGPFGYQWTLDGVAVGSNESTLTVNTASLPVGDHVVGLTVNGECGFAIKSAMLSVQPVTSASGPTDTTACLDQDVSFATVASGTEPFSWQWTLDGNAVGTNGPSLTVQTAGLSLGDHAVDVVVSGPCGSAVTNSARLTVQTSFGSKGPEAVSVCHGADANLLTTASGSGPFTYQWSLDGGSVGTNGPGLTVPTVGLALGDHAVQVIVSGQCAGVVGVVTNATTLSVEAAPPNVTCSAVPGASADGNCQATVPNVMGGVSVSEGCSGAGSITLSQSPEAGTLVGLGTHTITVTATDAATNSATCTTTFTVTDTT